ncbi:cache domain-containing sensor histidine kinase [Paenibacillus pini]|uniref:Integral membrane sensor signal transduction histidine kinase n=1 Tax=Paenibacillus pini JCM 16418 TaxID=1236976 RepID=W7YV36_9BACL|nr:sensor histidine kinase [Paenibacillus pini]GAF08471.1 integral membrane sensor signal transduction histidine kinase [Paenibacillus pini JCM 16418]
MKISLRKQMIFSFSTVFILLIVIFGSLILNYNISNYQKQSFDYVQKIVKANISLSDNYLEQLITVSKIVANDSDILKAVTYRNSVKEVDYSVELYNQRNVAAKIKQLDVLNDITNALIIGNDDEYLYYYGSSPVRGYHFGAQEWFTNANLMSNKYIHFTNFHPTDYLLNDKNKQTVSVIVPILNANQYSISKRAYLMCDFNLDPIIVDSSSKGNSQIAIFDGTNPVYFTNKSWLAESQKAEIAESLTKEQKSFVISKTKDNPVSYLVVNETSKISGWSILGIMPLTELEQMRTTNTTFVIVIIVIACILVVFLSGWISRSILVPINSLIVKFNEIAAGRRDVSFKESRSIEINSIAINAENMLNNINHLTDEIIEEQKRVASAQFKVLQHQINPHFLNNVLQSIKAMAVCGDVESVSRAVTLLGKILSYSVYNPYEQVGLQEELSYTENYILLQNIRFNNLITYTMHCDDHLQHFTVPKLMIQPLVENAIEHGFQNHQEGHITIVAEDVGHEIYIAVTNNGTVVDAAEVNRLNEVLQSEDTYKQNKSIGLLNLNQRLKSCFGPEAGIQIFSREGMNTSIVITIPK